MLITCSPRVVDLATLSACCTGELFFFSLTVCKSWASSHMRTGSLLSNTAATFCRPCYHHHHHVTVSQKNLETHQSKGLNILSSCVRQSIEAADINDSR